MALAFMGAGLFFHGVEAHGATLDVWLLIPTGPVTSNTDFSVQVWGQIQGTDAIGLSDFAVTVASTKTGFVEPKAGSAQFVSMTFGPEMGAFGLKISAARQDFEGDGDADAIQFVAGDINHSAVGLAITSPVLLATETWTMLCDGTQDCDELVPTVAPTSRFWDAGKNRVQFSGYHTTGAVVGVPSSGPLRFCGVTKLRKGALQLNVAGATPEQTNSVEASSDLISWVPISTNVPAANIFGVVDYAATNLTARFYRVVQHH